MVEGKVPLEKERKKKSQQESQNVDIGWMLGI